MTTEQAEQYKSMIASGEASCVIADDGGILYRAVGTGVFPLLDYVLQRNQQDKVHVFDKVMGSAAAILALQLSPAYVYGQLMSEGALALLNDNHVRCEYTDRTKHIRNRRNTGLCPLEERTLGITDLDAGMEIIEAWRIQVLEKG